MGLLNWLFGRKKEQAPSQPTIVTSMPSDDWLDWMLDELKEKDRRKKEPSYGGGWPDEL